jgi:hypothetical protein
LEVLIFVVSVAATAGHSKSALEFLIVVVPTQTSAASFVLVATGTCTGPIAKIYVTGHCA